MAMLSHTEYAVQKKEQIENGLLSLMETRQYQEISVTDICRETGVPRRTFYHYFENKEAVLESMIEEMMHQCFMAAIFDFTLAPEGVENSFLQVFRFWEGENRKKLDILMRNNLEAKLMTWPHKWVREEQIGVLQHSALDRKMMEIVMMIGTTDFFALLFHWSRGGYQETAEEIAKYAVLVLPHVLFNTQHAHIK